MYQMALPLSIMASCHVAGALPEHQSYARLLVSSRTSSEVVPRTLILLPTSLGQQTFHLVAHEEEASRFEIERLRRMTAAQKYAVIRELRAFAWRVKRAGIKAAHPKWTSRQIEDAVRESFLYGST